MRCCDDDHTSTLNLFRHWVWLVISAAKSAVDQVSYSREAGLIRLDRGLCPANPMGMAQWCAALLLLLLAGAVPAAAADRPPEITMRVVKDPIQIETGFGYRELRARAECYRRPAPGNYYGLAHTNLFVRIRFAIRVESVAAGITGELSEIHVSLHMGNPTVYVIDELAPESCAFDAILGHEKGHVAIDDALVDRYAPRFERTVRTVAREIGKVRGVDREAVVSIFRKAFLSALQGEMNDLEAARARRHGAHDTFREYRRLMRMCDGEAHKRLREAKKDSRPWYVDVECPRKPWSGGAS